MSETLAEWVDQIALPKLRSLVPEYIETHAFDRGMEPSVIRMEIHHPKGYRSWCDFHQEEFERNDFDGMEKLLQVRLYVIGASLKTMAEGVLETARLFPQD